MVSYKHLACHLYHHYSTPNLYDNALLLSLIQNPPPTSNLTHYLFLFILLPIDLSLYHTPSNRFISHSHVNSRPSLIATDFHPHTQFQSTTPSYTNSIITSVSLQTIILLIEWTSRVFHKFKIFFPHYSHFRIYQNSNNQLQFSTFFYLLLTMSNFTHALPASGSTMTPDTDPILDLEAFEATLTLEEDYDDSHLTDDFLDQLMDNTVTQQSDIITDQYSISLPLSDDQSRIPLEEITTKLSNDNQSETIQALFPFISIRKTKNAILLDTPNLRIRNTLSQHSLLFFGQKFIIPPFDPVDGLYYIIFRLNPTKAQLRAIYYQLVQRRIPIRDAESLRRNNVKTGHFRIRFNSRVMPTGFLQPTKVNPNAVLRELQIPFSGVIGPIIFYHKEQSANRNNIPPSLLAQRKNQGTLTARSNRTSTGNQQASNPPTPPQSNNFHPSTAMPPNRNVRPKRSRDSTMEPISGPPPLQVITETQPNIFAESDWIDIRLIIPTRNPGRYSIGTSDQATINRTNRILRTETFLQEASRSTIMANAKILQYGDDFPEAFRYFLMESRPLRTTILDWNSILRTFAARKQFMIPPEDKPSYYNHYLHQVRYYSDHDLQNATPQTILQTLYFERVRDQEFPDDIHHLSLFDSHLRFFMPGLYHSNNTFRDLVGIPPIRMPSVNKSLSDLSLWHLAQHQPLVQNLESHSRLQFWFNLTQFIKRIPLENFNKSTGALNLHEDCHAVALTLIPPNIQNVDPMEETDDNQQEDPEAEASSPEHL